MEENRTALSPLAEAQYLALEYMRQKALTDDAPADIAREYSTLRQQLYAALSGSVSQSYGRKGSQQPGILFL